jgi:hypothetical protein
MAKSLASTTMRILKQYPVESLMVAVGIVIGIVGTFCEFYGCFKS